MDKTASGIIEVFGGITCLAKELGESPQVVGNWKRRGRIPSERWEQIIEISDSKKFGLTIYDLLNHTRKQKTRKDAGKRTTKRVNDGDKSSPAQI